MSPIKCKECVKIFSSESLLSSHQCQTSKITSCVPNDQFQNTTSSTSLENKLIHESSQNAKQKLHIFSLDMSHITGRTRRYSMNNNDKVKETVDNSFNSSEENNQNKTEIHDDKTIVNINFKDLSPKVSVIKSNSKEILTDNVNRTDEIDREAKRISKLSFTCQQCGAEFETSNQFKTHQLIHEFESLTNRKRPFPTSDTDSYTNSLSSSENTSEYKSPIKKPSYKRRKIVASKSQISDSELVDPSMKSENIYTENLHCIKSEYSESDNSKTINFNDCTKKYKEYTCNISSITDLKEWVENNEIPEFGCNICGIGFEEYDKLVDHKLNGHPNFEIPKKNLLKLL